MIYRAGEPITFVAFYMTPEGIVKSDLTVYASIYKVGEGGGLICDLVATELMDGLYYVTFTPEEDGIYVALFTTEDTSVAQRTLAAIAFQGIGGVNNLDVPISSRLSSGEYQVPPSVIEIDERLSSTHGAGSWQSGTLGTLIEPLVVKLTPTELVAVLSGSNRKDLEVFRGDFFTVDVTVLNVDNTPVDLTGASAVFTVRPSVMSEEIILQKDLEVVDALGGQMRLSLIDTDTDCHPGRYPADIQLTLADGTIKTIWRADFVVKWDITR